MASKVTEASSLWLPGFGIDDAQAFPDLFSESPPPPIGVIAETTAKPADVTRPRSWRPTIRQQTATITTDWPHWADSALDGLEGAVTKFEANLAAIATLRELVTAGRDPSPEERRSLLRFTGWGGIPASFNRNHREATWKTRADRLAAALGPSEYEAARASVNTSHYTDPKLIRWIWQAVRTIGFCGGSILEPSAGIGHFLGCMPMDIARASRITAIELDDIAGGILKALYRPLGVDVRVQGAESAVLAEDCFDLVISNVPFGNFPVSDGRNRPYSRFSIHNWFVGKALDVLRSGGLACFITSTYLLDELDQTARAHVASRADLLTAFRLPQGTFSRLASTDAQADLVIFRKLAPGDAQQQEVDWSDLGCVPESLRHPRCSDPHMRINTWFVNRPGNVLGRIDKVSNGHYPVPTAVLDRELVDALQDATALVPAGGYCAASMAVTQAARAEQPLAPAGSRPGAFVVHDGRICVSQGGELTDVHAGISGVARQRIAGMCEIRDKARALLAAQLDDTNDQALASMRLVLNTSYDRFVAKHGCLTSRANSLAFRRDPDYPLLLSLEHYDEEEETAEKADIFRRRTVARIEEPRSAENPDEALALCVQWKGRVDPEYMACLLGSDAEAVIADLLDRALIYQDPTSGQFETADAYLSGDVKRKLKAAAAAGALFQRNVVALEKVIPEDLPPASIEPRLGAVWIPSDVIEAFLIEVLKVSAATVRYLDVAGTWSVRVDRWFVKSNVTCTQEFGTTRMDAVELVEAALNVQTPTVHDPHAEKDGAYVVNKEQRLPPGKSWAPSKSASRRGPTRNRAGGNGCAGSTTTCSTA